MADAGQLPSYDDLDAQAAHSARSQLKKSFENLKHDHLDIQELFRTVASQLRGMPEIGEQHLLLDKWDGLREVRSLIRPTHAAFERARRGTSGSSEIRSRTPGCAPDF